MNNSNLKKYAPNARLDFIEAITERATIFGITEKTLEPAIEKGDTLLVGSKVFPKSLAIKRKKLEERIKREGFKQVIEAIAYTWFNRLVAIRYMELKGYLDHGYRVLSHPKNSATPEILEHAEHLEFPGLHQKTLIDLKLEGTKESELYRLILIAQCNALNKAMPFLFESIDDETELLLPENLLHSDSLIRKLVDSIPEEDWNEVEIIGWLYQFYISDKKDEVIGKVVKSEDIPAATQLFTPNWIVKYLLQNSLGRQWMATYPESPLKEKMEYYIEPAEQTPEVQQQLAEITPTALNPEELTLMDPACGSGHILVEAYTLLKAIYQERGYRTRDIPHLILTKNLYGLEIDDRAAQLASFALLMKARADDNRIFNSDIKLNILSIQESKGLEVTEITESLNASMKAGVHRNIEQADIQQLIDLFEHGKTFGSLIRIPEDLASKLPTIAEQIRQVAQQGEIFSKSETSGIQRIVAQAQRLSRQYDNVVTNPPYMGNKGMNPSLKTFAQKNYPDAKSDLFSIFIERSTDFAIKKGMVSMITMQSWMFLSSFETLRCRILGKYTILSMAHLGSRAFDSIGGEVVSTTAFVLKNLNYPEYKGDYFRLVGGNSEAEKETATLEAIQNPNCDYFHRASASDFKKIPGSPIAYWVNMNIRLLFEKNKRFDNFATPAVGLNTGDNDRFLKLWNEVSLSKIVFECSSITEASKTSGKWFPYNKGGEYRKWYGNKFFVINWECDGKEVKKYAVDRNKGKHWSRYIQNLDWMFQEGVTWSATSSSYFGCRYTERGFLFDVKGTSAFSNKINPYVMIGFLTTKLVSYILNFLNPTIEFQTRDIRNLPFVAEVNENKDLLNICRSSIEVEKKDWNAYETSWDFTVLPLLHIEYHQPTLNTTYQNLRTRWRETTLEMQQLEEENNRIFIEAYGLQEEMTPEVPLKEITLTCNPYYRYGGDKSEEELEALLLTDTMKEFISYAVGCMFGRYSLDKPGLVLANQGETVADYLAKIPEPTFKPNENNVIPLLDGDWFPDDIVDQFCRFLRITFGEAQYQENLDFIETAIAKDIRNYFLKGFYDDHLKRYKKRPIYWLFSSGKQRAFQCLVYLHRYNEGTLARMRTEYVIPLLGRMASRLEQLGNDLTKPTSSAHGKKLEKERGSLLKQQRELQEFDEKLRHFADKRICLDLDDGVKVNYGKFGDLLAEVKAVTGDKVE